MIRFKHIIWAVVALLVIAAAGSTLFAVDETQLVIVSQFGKPVKVIDSPGLKIKLPAPFHTLIKFDKRLTVFNARPSEFLTQDKKNVVVEAFAFWRIKDAQKFLQTVKARKNAEISLGTMISSEVGAALGTIPLHSLVSVNPEEVKVNEIMKKVTENCAGKADKNYGIEIVSVRLKRINFPDQNKIAVYNRMRSERERIAKKYRAEGKEQASKIKAETDKEVSKILSEAYKDSEKIKGEGDAAAAGIYAKAYNKDPRFYKLTRTLESYSKFLDEQTTVVLSSDSELLELLGKGSKQ